MELTVGQIFPQVYKQMPSFKGENAKTIKPQKDGISKLGATLACLACLGAGVATVAYAFKKGKLTGTGLAEGGSLAGEFKPAEILKEYTIDGFRNAGHRFEKNIAKTSDGKNYTGILTSKNKQGNTFVLKYENGMLKKYVKKAGEKEQKVLFYHYYPNGNISSMLSTGPNQCGIVYKFRDDRTLLLKDKVNYCYLYYPDGKTLKMYFSIFTDSKNAIYDINGEKIVKITPDGFPYGWTLEYIKPQGDVREFQVNFTESNLNSANKNKSCLLHLTNGERYSFGSNNSSRRGLRQYIYEDGGSDALEATVCIDKGSRKYCVQKNIGSRAEFDPVTGEISIMPDSGLSKKEVKKFLNKAQNLTKLIKKHYRTIVELRQTKKLAETTRQEFHNEFLAHYKSV